MTTETILTPAQIEELSAKHLWAHAQFVGAGDVHIEGDEAFARAIEQAVLQSPEIQALRNMLYEARCQLPLAAQFWNEDDDQDRSRRNVQHVMGLIKRIDSALEKQP